MIGDSRAGDGHHISARDQVIRICFAEITFMRILFNHPERFSGFLNFGDERKVADDGDVAASTLFQYHFGCIEFPAGANVHFKQGIDGGHAHGRFEDAG